MTNFAKSLSNSGIKAAHDDGMTSLAGIALLVLFLIVVCLVSMSPGTTPDELALMTVLP